MRPNVEVTRGNYAGETETETNRNVQRNTEVLCYVLLLCAVFRLAHSIDLAAADLRILRIHQMHNNLSIGLWLRLVALVT